MTMRYISFSTNTFSLPTGKTNNFSPPTSRTKLVLFQKELPISRWQTKLIKTGRTKDAQLRVLSQLLHKNCQFYLT